MTLFDGFITPGVLDYHAFYRLSTMNKRIRVEPARLARFDFEAVRSVKARIEAKPELKEALKTDFKGALKAEGIQVNREFLARAEAEWRHRIASDLRAKATAEPSKNPLLKAVVDGKPIRVHVKVTKGKIEKTKEAGA